MKLTPLIFSAVSISLAANAVTAAEYRAGFFAYDGGTALYALSDGQQIICDNCPRPPVPEAAPREIFAGSWIKAVEAGPPLPQLSLSQKNAPAKAVEAEQEPLATVYFKFGDARLSPAEKMRIRMVLVGQDKQIPVAVRVDGHTCRIGTTSYNRNLSTRRAKAVAAYLRSLGVKIAAVEGFSSSRPKGGELSRDRRAEIIVKERIISDEEQ